MQQVPADATWQLAPSPHGHYRRPSLPARGLPVAHSCAIADPGGYLPKKKGGRAKVYLYPAEDRKLLGCTTIPLVLRLFYGMLTREGLRVGELAGLEVSDFDLENGILVLDEDKTDEPRQWAMATGTTEALRRYLHGFHPCPRPESRILFTPHIYAPEYVTNVCGFGARTASASTRSGRN